MLAPMYANTRVRHVSTFLYLRYDCANAFNDFIAIAKTHLTNAIAWRITSGATIGHTLHRWLRHSMPVSSTLLLLYSFPFAMYAAYQQPTCHLPWSISTHGCGRTNYQWLFANSNCCQPFQCTVRIYYSQLTIMFYDLVADRLTGHREIIFWDLFRSSNAAASRTH